MNNYSEMNGILQDDLLPTPIEIEVKAELARQRQERRQQVEPQSPQEIEAIMATLVNPDVPDRSPVVKLEGDVECQLIAACFRDKEFLQWAAQELTPQHFYHDVLAKAFSIAAAYVKQYDACPSLFVIQQEIYKMLGPKGASMADCKKQVGEMQCAIEGYNTSDAQYLKDQVGLIKRKHALTQHVLAINEARQKGDIDLAERIAASPPVINNSKLGQRRAYLIRDLMNLPKATWQVEKHISLGSYNCIFGPYDVGKSFYALDMLLCVAAGKPFHGYKVHKGPVAYICGEGSEGMSKRIYAWMDHYQIATIDTFALLPAVFDLKQPEEANAILCAVKEQLGCLPELLAIDTRHKMFGGGDENSPKDMGAYVAITYQIVEQCKAQGVRTSVLTIDHTGKDEDRGPRGHSSFPAACDSIIKLSGDMEKAVKVACYKQKDAAPFPPYQLSKLHIDVPFDETKEGSLVLIPSAVSDEPPSAEEIALLKRLHAAFGYGYFEHAKGLEISTLTKGNYNTCLGELKKKGLAVKEEKKSWCLNKTTVDPLLVEIIVG